MPNRKTFHTVSRLIVQRRLGAVVLCRRFAQGQCFQDWLQGKEKNPEVVRGWCNDFVATQNGREVEIQAYLTMRGGSVERWVLRAQFEKHLFYLTDISIKEIGGPGALDYWLVPWGR